MNLKHKEIEIPKENPFQNCKLEREKYATILTNIVSTYSQGFVMSINNKWGTGKTTFVKMWEQQLKNENFQTVYLNAWENDFEDNPLSAIMGELKTLTSKQNDENFKGLLKMTAVFTKHLAPKILTALASKHLLNGDKFETIIENIANGATEIFEHQVDQYSEKKKGIEEFKTELSHFIASTSSGKPLVFIIDELDRCRPNYAVLLLEQVKHFFSIPNIVFVLSIDKMQLGNAVRGVYGSDRIDADEYLRRFIDIEYTIPQPKASTFNKYLFDYFDYDSFFNERDHPEIIYDKTRFLSISKLLFSNTTLRGQEKVFAQTRITIRSFKHNEYVFPTVLLYLIYLKHFHSNIYNSIILKEYPYQKILEDLKQFVYKESLNETDKRLIHYLKATLILLYFNYQNNQNNSILKTGVNGKPKLNIDINDNNDGAYSLISLIKEMRYNDYRSLSLEHLINKIELIEELKR